MTRRQTPSNVETLHTGERQNFLYRCIYGLVSGLSYLHSDIEGVFTAHHDLKPSNIIWIKNEWKIADFGNSRLRPLIEGSETEGVSGLGTYEYQPPEYWNQDGTRAKAKYGRAFDVWSMGCIIIELATLVVHAWQPGMVMNFRNDRRQNPNRDRKSPDSIEDGADNSFHNNQTILKSWVLQLKGVDHSKRLNEVLSIASKMLAPKAKNRPYMWEIEMDLDEALKPDDGLIPRLGKDLCVRPPFKNHLEHDFSHLPDIEDFTETPLHRAAQKNDRKRTIRLWELGWPLSLKDLDGKTPLEIMKASEEPELNELEDNVTQMLEAAKAGNIEKVKESFETGLSEFMPNSNGTFALHEAINLRNIDMVNYLLEHRAKEQIELWDRSKQEYPLHKAARIGFVKALERMLKEKTDVNIRREEGLTPLYFAAEKHQLEAVRILLKHGAQVLVPELETLRMLWTPLHAAIHTIRSTIDTDLDEIVELLLQANDGHKCVNRKDALQTPALLSAFHGRKGCLRLLLQHGASINTATPDGMNLLHCIAKHGWHDILQEYIDQFSLEQLQARWARVTPFEVAYEYGHKDIARLLKARLPTSRTSLQHLIRKIW